MKNIRLKTLNHSTTYSSPGNPGSYAACFVEVKVDTYTGHVTINDCLVAQDVGKAINPQSVVGQIVGGAHPNGNWNGIKRNNSS